MSKFIVVNKHDNKVIMYGNQLDYLENGYPRLVEENAAFIPNLVNVFEVDAIPEDYVDGKYFYTEADGFQIDPNWELAPNQNDIVDNADAICELTEYVAELEARIEELEGGK